VTVYAVVLMFQRHAEKRAIVLSPESAPPPPLASFAIFFAFAIKSARSFAKAGSALGGLAAIEIFFPVNPRLQADGRRVERRFGPNHEVRVLPGSSEPTRASIRSCFAGLIVTNLSASDSGVPPNFTALAASV
jgi:hypothetical protein